MRPELPVRRNTALLSAALAANSGMLQLSAAVASLTFVLVIGVQGLLGLGPAIVLASGALAALPARTAAGDMYPPERRARGIALVLVGAVFGAILGPAVFSPLLSGRELDDESLALLWLAGSGFMLVALALVVFVRPDPRRIAELLHTGTVGVERPPSAPLRELLRRHGVIPSILAAQASFSVGGDVIARRGRPPALGGGVALLAFWVISLLWIGGGPATATALFGL